MKLYNFLLSKKREIDIIISELNDEFSSHEFIHKLSRKFERDYIEMLENYKNTKIAHQITHRQIGRFLSLNSNALKIKKVKKVNSLNVFGGYSKVQFWVKSNE